MKIVMDAVSGVKGIDHYLRGKRGAMNVGRQT